MFFDIEILIPYIEMIIPLSALIAVSLSLTPFFNKRYVAKLRYYIWLIIALRLIFPFDINIGQTSHIINAPLQDYTFVNDDNFFDKSNDGTVNEKNESTTDIPMDIIISENIGDSFYNDSDDAVNQTPSGNIIVKNENFFSPGYIFKTLFPVIRVSSVIANVWIYTAIILLIYHIYQYSIARTDLKNNSNYDMDAQQILDNICRQIGLRNSLKVYRNPDIGSAIIVGIVKPAIYIPDIKYTDSMLEVILFHELMHYKRKDILYKFIILVACCMHWYNPLVWLMDRQAQKDIEVACDEDVIKGKNDDFIDNYSNSIISMIKVAHTSRIIFSTGFANNKKVLIHRFSNIYNKKIKHNGKSVLALILILAVFSSTLISCAPADIFKLPQQAMDFIQFYCNYRDDDNLIDKNGYDLGFAYLYSNNLLKDKYIHSYSRNGDVESYRLPMKAMMDVYQFIVSRQMPTDWWGEIPELQAMSWAADYNYMNAPYKLNVLSAEKSDENIINVTLSRTREGVPHDNIKFTLEQQTVEYVPEDLTSVFESGEKIWRIKNVDIIEGSWQPEKDTIVEISTVDDYLAFVKDYNANGYNRVNYTYKLMNDIDFKGMELTPVGGTTTAPQFEAQFDGQGYTLSNFKITYDMYTGESEYRKIGLFSSLGGNKNAEHIAEIRNLNIKDAYISPVEDEKDCTVLSAGILCGAINGGYVSDCNISGYVEGRVNIGGIVGYRSDGYINNCITDVQVNGNAEIGCFAGTLHMSRVQNCESRGTVTGYSCEYSESFYYDTPYRIGGFAGTIHSSVIDSCYANANLKIMNTAKNVGAFSGTGERSDFLNCRYNTLKAGKWDIVDYYYSPESAKYVINPV